jgi:DNA repair exonuclease SbcCD ATPase subunit
MNTLLQTLSDRTAALSDLRLSLGDLGFPGSDASEIISSLSGALRAARLELEYLSPGEIPLPLTAAGAAVLDLLLDRLRELSRKSREADDTIDEYHALELELRQQLDARVEAMDGMSREARRMEGDLAERDGLISELEIGLERLKGAVKSYTRDVAELEALVQRMEGDLERSAALRKEAQEAHETETARHAEELEQQNAAMAELESKLSSAVEQSEALRVQLATIHIDHADQLTRQELKNRDSITSLNKSHGQALALRDARVSELRTEMDRINASLRAAHETVRKVRVENGQLRTEKDDLSTRLAEERKKAKEAVDSMKAELQRVLSMTEGLLATPRTKKQPVDRRRDSAPGEEHECDDVDLVRAGPDGRQGGFLSGELARKGRGKKRRRYDSGLGFLDEEEMGIDV